MKKGSKKLNIICNTDELTFYNLVDKTKRYIRKYEIIEVYCNDCKEIKQTGFINVKNAKGKWRCKPCFYKFSKTKEFIQKRIETNIKKFGCPNPQQNKEIQEKTKQTCLNKYGVKNPFQSKENKEKIKQTNLDRYNVKNPSQNKEIQEKSKQTCLDRYDVKNPFQHEKTKNKIKKTNIDRYGVDNPAKNKEIQDKIAKKVNDPSTKFHWKTNKELNCQGGWEPKVIDYLNTNKLNYEWQPKPVELSDGSTYRPDFLLTDSNTYIEIKGRMYPDAKIKWNDFSTKHTNSELWDKKKLKQLKIL